MLEILGSFELDRHSLTGRCTGHVPGGRPGPANPAWSHPQDGHNGRTAATEDG